MNKAHRLDAESTCATPSRMTPWRVPRDGTNIQHFHLVKMQPVGNAQIELPRFCLSRFCWSSCVVARDFFSKCWHHVILVCFLPLLIASTSTVAHAQTRPDHTTLVALVPASHPPNEVQADAFALTCQNDPSQKVQGWDVKGWAAYERLWREFAQSPSNTAIRKFLGLPIGNAADEIVAIKVTRGRSAPRWLNWKAGSYQQIETPHLRIYSRATQSEGEEVAADLERVFWIWSQLFFPLWDASGQVALHLDRLDSKRPIAQQLESGSARLASRKKLRVVLFKDTNEYRASLGQSVPGVEQSTGFYSDERQTAFFYPDSSTDAVATRRHEMVHQLFREATRSTLKSGLPGGKSDFWLIEGIAGYFESLSINGAVATLGGWHSPRLQFARLRVLGNREHLPLESLRPMGHQQVQRSGQLAQWYAHSIAHTHALLDGPSVSSRRFIYQTLADLYQVRLDVPQADHSQQPIQELANFLRVDDHDIQSNLPVNELSELCLCHCEVSEAGLASLSPQSSLTWLNLARLPVDTDAVIKLCPQPTRLDQLTLEITRVDNTLSGWLRRANELTELDLSWTACGDGTVKSLLACPKLETLWLTGSQVTDASINTILQLPRLESIDLQRTQITPAGVAKIKSARPGWNVNPLRLIAE